MTGWSDEAEDTGHAVTPGSGGFVACGATDPERDGCVGGTCRCLLTDCVGDHRCACGHTWAGEAPAGNNVSRQLRGLVAYFESKGAALQALADGGSELAAGSLPAFNAVTAHAVPALRSGASEIERLCRVADRAEAALERASRS